MISSFGRGSPPFSVLSLSLTYVGILGGGESAVGALGAAESELEQLDLCHVAGGDAVARRVRRYQTGDPIQVSICDRLGQNCLCYLAKFTRQRKVVSRSWATISGPSIRIKGTLQKHVHSSTLLS